MQLRAPLPDDAPAVFAVLEARNVADLGVPDYTLADLTDEWRLSDFKLTDDARVVELDDGRIVAYAAVMRPGVMAAVAPGHEGQGIGAQLLQWAERRERQLGRDRHRQWISAGNERGQALLRAAGYAPVRSYWRMVRRLDSVTASAPLPVDVRLRPLDLGRDAVALHALDRLSFAANPDYEPETLEAFREEHLEAHDLDPGLSCVAEHGGQLAGFLLARRWDGEAAGFVDVLAVHPDHQRRGLGTALLRRAFARFAAAGLAEAQLGVASDNRRALALYERVGMTPRFRVDTYERPVSAHAGEPHDERG
jgi:mycothiol synthase